MRIADPCEELFREMAYITRAELLNALRDRSLEDVVRDVIFSGVPWAFRNSPADYRQLLQHVSSRLAVPEDRIQIVGSGKVGFSVSPDTFGTPFSGFSDIDILLVDQSMFDQIWDILLDWRYPWHLRKWPTNERPWGIERLEEFICGWCMPSEIKFAGLTSPRPLRPLRDISTRWFDTFQSLAMFPSLAARHYNGRLYRSWEHAMRYHVWSMKKIRESYCT